MGRSKIPIEYIQKDKKRSTTYDKRKKGLLKKAYELATLCDVPLCVVIYPGPNSAPATYPEKEEVVRAVIERYTSGSREANAKRSINLQQGLELGKKKKGDDQRRGGGSGGGCGVALDGHSREELVNLASVLDYKLYQVEERIRMAASLQVGGGGGGGCGFDHKMQWPIVAWQPDQRQDHVAGSSSGGGGVGGVNYDPLTGPNFYFSQVGSSNIEYAGGVKFEPDQYMSAGANPGLKWYEQGRQNFLP